MPPAQRDFYEVLGIARNASADEIKRAYRKLAMEYHPDRNSGADAADRFKEINRAYEVLSDTDKRSAFDRFGHAGVDGAGGPAGFDGFSTFEGFGDIFDAFFSGAGRGGRRRGPARGADLRARITLTFEEAAFGAERELDYARLEHCDECRGSGAAPGSKPEVCPECNGAGEIRRAQQSVFGQFVNVSTCGRCRGEGRVIANPCANCRGRGGIRKSRQISVKIPAGVDDGQQVRLTGEGEVGERGGQPGNLYVLLDVQPHELFERLDDHILYDLPLNVAQAALGTSLEIPTLEGDMAFDVPAGTQSGDEFVVRGQGVPRLNSSRRGDMIVRATVVVPESLTEEQQTLLEELAETLGTPSLPHRNKSFLERLRDAVAG